MITIPGAYSLYIHIPWCVEKCPYCDFNSHAIREPVNEAAYLQALLEDFSQELHDVSGRSLKSIFIGGGTPSTLTPSFYQQLLGQIQQLSGFAKDIEITLEANPGTVDADNFAGYRESGINRLSMGFQSFQDDKLRRLGRIHTAEQARDAFRVARLSGFDNINIDLMFALPGQSLQEALTDLQQVTQLQPEHLSWYQLTLEPNTAFFASPPVNMPDDDLAWEIQSDGQKWLQQQDYQQYEISAYCHQGRECQHNLNYWQFGDYVGIGAGAHGKLTLNDKKIVRRSKKRNPADYLRGDYLSQENILKADDLLIEFLMNRLRLKTGFALPELATLTETPAAELSPLFEQAISQGLLTENREIIRPTELGHRFLNELLSQFL